MGTLLTHTQTHPSGVHGCNSPKCMDINSALEERSRNGKGSSQEAGGGARGNRPKEPSETLGLDAGAAALGEEGYKVGSARAQSEAGQGATTPGLVLHLSHQPQLGQGAEKHLHTEEESLKSRESASGGLLLHK